MQPTHHSSWTTILLVMLSGLLLSITPLPPWAAPYRPPFVSLAIFYWILAAPERIGVFSAWILGLAEDAITGALLGQNALAHSITAYICLQVYRRIRFFPPWQQAFVILGLLLLERILQFWVYSSTGHMPDTADFWFSPLVGAFIWPWVIVLVSDMHRIKG